MELREVMVTSIPTVPVDAPLAEVAEILSRRHGSAVLVVADDGEVVGVVTEAALARALSRIVEEIEAAPGFRRARAGALGRLTA